MDFNAVAIRVVQVAVPQAEPIHNPAKASQIRETWAAELQVGSARVAALAAQHPVARLA